MCPKDNRPLKDQCGTLAHNTTGASELVDRGIGVSVAVGQRAIIARLRAWDDTTHAQTHLEPGITVSNYEIKRHSQAEIDQGAEPYVMRFTSGGRPYSCALATFQARTEPVADRPAET